MVPRGVMRVEFVDPTLKLYMAVGAGGAAVIIVFASFLYLLVRIYPRLNTIENSAAATSKAIEQNAEALTEVSRSNDNLAHALTLLERGLTATNDNMKALMKQVDRQTDKVGEMQMVLAQVEVRTASCPKPFNYKG